MMIVRAVPLLVLFPAIAVADGFRNPFQSAAAAAQGNAFAARANDGSAVFYYPASMTQLRGVQQVNRVGLVNVNIHYKRSNGRSTENDLGGPFGFPPPLQFFQTAKLKDLDVKKLGNLTVGFGLLSLFGFASRYPKSGALNTAVIKSQLPLRKEAVPRLSDVGILNNSANTANAIVLKETRNAAQMLDL
jgi:long-chain fatty acid transport protein